MSNKKSISNSFSVSTIEDGAQGKRGRFYYYKGDWDDFALDAEFPVSDSQMPFFKVVRDGQTRYYVFNPEQNKIYMKAEMGEPSNNAPWEIMTNDFKYLITEAIFSNFAHLGGAIISGDWMISQHGSINGVASTSYQMFDPAHPNDDMGTNFIPSYALDMLNGTTYQHDAYLTGSIYTKSVQTIFAELSSSAYIRSLIIGVDQTIDNINIVGIWSYMMADGTTIIVLPTNQYRMIGQRVIIYNPFLGVGGTSNQTHIVTGDVYSPEYVPVPGEDTWYGNSVNMTGKDGWQIHYRTFRGIGILKSGGDIHKIDDYTQASSIYFCNGIVELMCVPLGSGHVGDTLCEWSVVNIGTNIYRLNYQLD